jgi:hypothetical protein
LILNKSLMVITRIFSAGRIGTTNALGFADSLG